jgi:hypothetical protein
MADNEATEAARKRLAEEREATEKSRQEYLDRAKGKPTPTQEENDLAALGAHLVEKEEDGSPLDPNVRQTKQSEAKKPAGGGNYETRAQQPAQPKPVPPQK